MIEIIDIFHVMLWSVALTIAIELIVALLLGVREKSDIGYLIIINYITNPIFNFAMYVISHYIFKNTMMIILVLIGEVIVVLCEYKFLKNKLKFDRINPLLLSVILNIASVVLGHIINTIK